MKELAPRAPWVPGEQQGTLGNPGGDVLRLPLGPWGLSKITLGPWGLLKIPPGALGLLQIILGACPQNRIRK